MQHNHEARGVARTLLGVLIATSLAACGDEAPVSPKPKFPEGGVQSLSPKFVDLLPAGQQFLTKPAFITGSPNGKAPYVQVYDKDGAQLIRFLALPNSWDVGGAEVALGDVNGDGWPDIIVGEGPAHFAPIASRIIIWDGHTGGWLATGLADGNFHDGVRVGAGDYDGDGKDEVFVCTGPSTLPTHYEILKFSPTVPHLPAVIPSQTLGSATGKTTYNGCRVAGGDLDNDGKDELIAVFEGPANALLIRNGGNTGVQVRWNAFGAGYTGSTSIAAADVTGDKKAEVFLGRLTGTDKTPPVFMYDGAKVMANSTLPTPAIYYPITNSIYNTGVYVGARDLSGDGVPELLAKMSTTGGYSTYVARMGPTFSSLWLNRFEPPGTLPGGGPIN